MMRPGMMRAWDFDRVIVSHGDVLERGGKAAFERAFARWLERRS